MAAFLHSSIYLYRIHCEGDSCFITGRVSVTWFGDLLVQDSICEQVPALCCNASFRLVSYLMVNGHFLSDLYHFCSLLSMRSYTQIEIAMQAASKVGVEGCSLLSGPFLCQ